MAIEPFAIRECPKGKFFGEDPVTGIWGFTADEFGAERYTKDEALAARKNLVLRGYADAQVVQFHISIISVL